MATCTCSTPRRSILPLERPIPLPETTSEHLCAQCASLDLTTLLQSGDRKDNYNRPWLKSTMGSVCPLCRFLATVASARHPFPPPGPDTEIKYRLTVVGLSSAFNPLLADAVQDMSLYDFKVLGVQTDHSDYRDMPDCCILPTGYNSQNPKWPTFREIDSASIDFSILRNWLLYCQTHHSASCAPLDQALSKEIPDLKLIDCKARKIVQAPKDTAYVALSYVWGKSHAAEATFLGWSLPRTLPRTIEDAIQAVLRLNLNYLWVDKYCINQSSDVELAQQISIMDMIYNSAFCTIIAACGEDASFGLPGVGLTTRLKQPAICLDGQVWISSLKNPEPVIEASTWASRAWTYQEGLFSRRRLIFTEEQVYFECNNTRCRETVSYDLHYLKDKMRLSPGGLFKGSYPCEARGGLDKHIEAYTRRSLSFQNDIINALSGVFRLYSSMPTPTRHYWGVPMDYNSHWYSCWPANSAAIEPRPSDRFEGYIDAAFARGLSWHLDIACSRRSGFPSWSWSGWIGPFAEDGWGDDVGLCRNSEVKIWLQRANGEHERLSEPVVANINNLGPTYTGYAPILRLEAWAIEINLTYLADGLSDVITPYFTRNPDPRYFVSIEAPEAPWFGGINGTWRWPVVLSMPVEEGDELHGELCRETFICVLLSKAEGFGLVVRKLAQGIMERIGYISIRWSHFDSEGPFDVVECFQIFSFDDVFDVFPKARRTILLR